MATAPTKHRVLRHKETGQIFAWTDKLATRSDMETTVATFSSKGVTTPPRKVREVEIVVPKVTPSIAVDFGKGEPLAAAREVEPELEPELELKYEDTPEAATEFDDEVAEDDSVDGLISRM